MTLPIIIALVFLAVFTAAVWLAISGGAAGSMTAGQTRDQLRSVLSPVGRDGDQQILDIRKIDINSNIPWLNRFLSSTDISGYLRLLLAQANLKWTVGGFLLSSLTLWMFTWYLVYLQTNNPPVALLIGMALGCIPLLVAHFKRDQQIHRFEQLLPEAIDHMVSALRAGQSLPAALNVVVREVPDPVGREFRVCYEEQNFGLDLRTAMHNLSKRVPIPDLQMVITAILIQKESGGNLAEVLEKTSSVVRERFRLQKQIRVHTAQGRLTGWILSLLPIALGIMLYVLNPDQMSVLWTKPAGVTILWSAAIMNVIGILLIRSIVKIRI